MKLTLENRGNLNVVRAYSPGEVRIGDTVVRNNCLVTATQLSTDWPPLTAEALTLADLEPIFALEPEIVLLGSGSQQVFPPAQIIAAVMARGVGFEVMDTGAACRTYNILVSEDRRVLAALFVK